jgi:hypothetical protein
LQFKFAPIKGVFGRPLGHRNGDQGNATGAGDGDVHYVLGRKVTVEYRSAEGRIGLLPQFTAELVQRNPAVHAAERDRPDRRLGDHGRGRRESTFPAAWSGARLLV